MSGWQSQASGVAGWEFYDWQKVQNGHIRIIGKSSPVPLEGIFTDVYMLDKPTALRRYDLDALREEFEGSSARRFGPWWGVPERHNGLNLVRDPANDRLFILGKPGAGKTTFLLLECLAVAYVDDREAIKDSLLLPPGEWEF